MNGSGGGASLDAVNCALVFGLIADRIVDVISFAAAA
jgi:hypothetical protein